MFTRSCFMILLVLVASAGVAAAAPDCGATLTDPADVARLSGLRWTPPWTADKFVTPALRLDPRADGQCWEYTQGNFTASEICEGSANQCLDDCIVSRERCVDSCRSSCGNEDNTQGSCFESCGDDCATQYRSCESRCT